MRDHPVPDHSDLTTDADEVAAGLADDRQIRMRVTSFRLDVVDPAQDLDDPPEVVHDLLVIQQARSHAEEGARVVARLRDEFDERLVEGRPGGAT